MKLLLAHPHLDMLGGSERMTSILVSELLEMGHEVGLVTASMEESWFPRRDEIKLYWIDRIQLLGDELADRLISDYKALKKAIDEFKPDASLVVIQETAYAALMKMTPHPLKTAVYVHFPYDEEISDVNLNEYIQRYRFPMLADKLVHCVDLLFCNSKLTQRAIKQHWKRNAVVVYPRISRFFIENKPEPDGERENTVIYIARTVPLKRQKELIRWFRSIRRKIPDARLVLAGYTDPRHSYYFDELRGELDQPDGVEFLGTVSGQKLLELYRTAKVYVHPRVGEHFGMAPIEAMSQGCPVIVRYPAGLCEVMRHRQTGYIARNDEQLVKYIEKTLTLPEKEWRRLSRNSIRFAARFSPRRFTTQIVKNLKKLTH
ncbi:MAG: glycosyltransferase family 4 protein [Aigarchaeota archaeon]|nr:glycosyltransferase family 4 protein [Candidatus Pelearchaeum maunauluense]